MSRHKGSWLPEWYHAPAPGHCSASSISACFRRTGCLSLAKILPPLYSDQAQHIIYVTCGSARNPEVKLEDAWVKTSAAWGNSCIPLIQTLAQSLPQHWQAQRHVCPMRKSIRLMEQNMSCFNGWNITGVIALITEHQIHCHGGLLSFMSHSLSGGTRKGSFCLSSTID